MAKWQKGSGGKPRGDSATTARASATRNTFRRANGLCPRLCYSRHKLSILELIYSFNLPTWTSRNEVCQWLNVKSFFGTAEKNSRTKDDHLKVNDIVIWSGKESTSYSILIFFFRAFFPPFENPLETFSPRLARETSSENCARRLAHVRYFCSNLLGKQFLPLFFIDGFLFQIHVWTHRNRSLDFDPS